jgi:hypothetical protein
MIVENMVLLELKSVERTSAAHKKQVQTYLRLSGRVPSELRGGRSQERVSPAASMGLRRKGSRRGAGTPGEAGGRKGEALGLEP